MKRLSAAAIFALLAYAFPLDHARAQDLGLANMLHQGALRAEDSAGRVLASYRDEELLIPASTMKVATSFCALEALGRDHRFSTRFYTGPNATLYVRGSGDPGLVSEELAIIASKLAGRIGRVDNIVVDTSFFAYGIEIDGMSRSLNPYDARNAAFVGNFSSAALTRTARGEIVSAEPQTPLTPLARAAAAKFAPKHTERVNLGHDWRTGARYGGELLAAFMSRAGIVGKMAVSLGAVPNDAEPLLAHESSQPLEDTVRGLLKYSTNFTANQVFLYVGASRLGAPATVEKGQKVLQECLRSKVGWSEFHAEEGSGLSRRNQVSAQQMLRLLKAFEPYKDLLADEDGFRAKTGTLTGVNTLVGYFNSRRHGPVRFAILVNRNVPQMYKFEVARELRARLGGGEGAEVRNLRLNVCTASLE